MNPLHATLNPIAILRLKKCRNDRAFGRPTFVLSDPHEEKIEMKEQAYPLPGPGSLRSLESSGWASIGKSPSP
ncbi:MAG: hypothetical protein JWO78_34 [Micavibrio sp.]|nr:hypothetical protein [Micavibrio sp.]